MDNKTVDLEMEIFRSGITLDNRKIDNEFVKTLFDNSIAILEENVRIPLRLGHHDSDPISKGEIVGMRLLEEDNREGKKTFLRKGIPEKNKQYRIIAKMRMNQNLFEPFIQGLLPERSVGLIPGMNLPSGKRIGTAIGHLAFNGVELGAIQGMQNPDVSYNVFDNVQHGFYFCNQNHDYLKFSITEVPKVENFDLEKAIAMRDAVAEVLKMAEELVSMYPAEGEEETETKEGAMPDTEMSSKTDTTQKTDTQNADFSSQFQKIQTDLNELVKHKNQLESQAASERKQAECKSLFNQYSEFGKVDLSDELAFTSVFNTGGLKQIELVYGSRDESKPPIGKETPSHRSEPDSAETLQMKKEMIFSYLQSGFSEDDTAKMMKMPKEKILEISANGRN